MKKRKTARRTRRKPAPAPVHTVKARLNVQELSKTGSSLKLAIYAHDEKIGALELGRGSLFWWGAKRKTRKVIPWSRFAEMMDRLAYD